MPSITTIIPVYNRASTISNCILSVLNQTTPISEIIVIDDCSTDNTIDVLKSFNGIKILRTEKQSGAQTARNIGIKAASNEWIAFIDSDDEWLPDKIERQISALEKINFDLFTVVHGDCIVKQLNTNRGRNWQLDKISGNNVYEQLLTSSGTFFPAILTSQKALEKIGYLDESIYSYQEWDTSIRLSKICNFIHIQEPLFIYNIQSDSISNIDNNNINGYYHIVKKYKKEIIKVCGINIYYKHLIICSNMAANSGKFEHSRKYLRGIRTISFKKGILLLLAYLHLKPKYIMHFFSLLSWKK